MQLKNALSSSQFKPIKKRSIADKLAITATALVGVTANAQNANEDDWTFVGSVLNYSEGDRVTALEAIVIAEKQIDDTATLTYKVVLDSLTGASANGAIAQNQPQTFTRPSGRGSYTVDPQDVPLDHTFKDTRVQFNVNWTDSLSEDSRYTLGSNLSKEFDFESVTFNGEYAKDFDRKNTTLSIGTSLAFDTFNPYGGRPLPLSSHVVNLGQFADQAAFDSAFNASRIDGDGDIDTLELLLGWTQVINRRTIMQFNYSFAKMSGYLNDPFKIVSLVDNNGMTEDNIYERRPDLRSQHTLFGMVKYHAENSVVDFSYRYLSDDWDIVSHTVDLKWHLFAGDNTFWEPHIRFYQQSAAEFYRPYLIAGDEIPEFVSADYRVGEMDAVTLGLKYGFNLSAGNRAEIRAEYYRQMPSSTGAEAIAAVNTLDIYPLVDAFTLQFTYFF